MSLKLLIIAIILQIFVIYANSEPTKFVNKDSKIVGFEEKQWFRDNIPFIEVPNKAIEDVYYYRWSSHKKHLRYTTLGSGYIVTEFVHNVGYSRKYGIINAAGGHQIHESRWLRDQKYAKNYINIFAREADKGLDHQYGEWVAHSAYQTYLLNGDKEYIVSQLDGFVKSYHEWIDHFEPKLGLYFIAPVWDAQEFSAASVQTKDKFGGGLGYRPSHNSQMYGNAIAIMNIAKLAGNTKIETEFKQRADALQKAINTHLWDKNRHFYYHMQRLDNPTNGLLDTREEVGLYPYRFQVPDNSQNYSIAWEQAFDSQGFDSKYGPTTCEMRSKWYDGKQKNPTCCWWNGNSWPYSTAHILSSLATQIRHYKTNHLNADNYVYLLNKYALTQYKNGKPYVAECHSPQEDFWVCDSRNHSEHYAHSTYTDNVLSELIGITPRSDDNIEIDPLVPKSWKYFIAENIRYHGHDITVLYDSDGEKYKVGKGMKVYVNGKLTDSQTEVKKVVVPVPKPVVPTHSARKLANYAANENSKGYPKYSASFTDKTGDVHQAVDGRIFFDGIPSNRWSNWESHHDEDWFAVDFGRYKNIDSVNLHVFSDIEGGKGGTACPIKIVVQHFDGKEWKNVENQVSTPAKCSPNDNNKISFKSVKTNQIRIVMTRDKANNHYIGLSEVEIWAEWPQTPSPNVYEVEDGIITDAEMESSPTASGQSYVGKLDGKSAKVEVTGIYALKSGSYKLRVFYANGEGKVGSHTLLVNQLHEVIVTYPVSKSGWAHFDDKTFVEITVPLLTGDNALVFQHRDNFAELDKIEVIV